MRIYRQLHLWIGLITSVLILIEAVTGLLMTEPWLMGMKKPPLEQQGESKAKMVEISERGEFRGEFNGGPNVKPGNQGNSLMHFVKNLHAGRIGNTDVSILLDIVAIGMIILTVTGITLSVRTLKMQSRKK
ncbi:PepSY domain-containing protein [Desulforamulus putei]|uniref:PepSY-associated TM region n=1 Tax=Desulforamulus putei DSM 12395 TaxID=1121429 RepID=A0A1M4WAR3_9FIRM|nr:PepSY domain-containing protein [Desulforamulus putei]SHE78358.1 PepSY-associated TM region [Desulforamulus putei DSM 12395]